MLLYVNYPSFIHPEIIPNFPYLRWYGLMYILAFLIAYLLIKYQLKKDKIKGKEIFLDNVFFVMILGILLGARIGYALFYDKTGYFLSQPWLIFWPIANGQWVGFQGLSYHGALIGGIISAWIYMRIKKESFLYWSDLIMASVPLGYTLGRLGNFINAELYGRVTTAPWGMIFPSASSFSINLPWVQNIVNQLNLEVTSNLINLPRHPSQLYEALGEGIILWLILWFLFRKIKPFNGFILCAYLFFYGLIRFIIEYFREPDPQLGFIFNGTLVNPSQISIFNISMGQILCLGMMLLALILCAIFKYYHEFNLLKSNPDKKRQQ